jgi:excisionase family DNA binding protein
METSDMITEQIIDRMTPVSAPPDQQKNIEALFRMIVSIGRGRHRDEPHCLLVGPQGESLPVPATVFSLLQRVTEVLARGGAISVVPVGKELTTQQAADILNISRQYLVRLLDEGRIPHFRVGKHRRVHAEDVLAFRRERDRDRRAALDELTELSEELGGYAELR